MKTNLILTILTFGLLISCKKERSITEINIINDYAEKIYYKLDILNDENDSIYQTDEEGKCSVLMTNKVYLDKNYFGSFDKVNLAVQKANSESTDSIQKRVTQKTTISVKNKQDVYEEIWTFDNEIDINTDDKKCKNCFGVYETKITLEDGITKYKNKNTYCIKIIFKEIDFGEGSITRTFIYSKNKEVWRLIKREKLNTKDKTYEVIEYDKDYRDFDCNYGNKENKIRISLSWLLD